MSADVAHTFALIEGPDLLGVNGDIILNGVENPTIDVGWKGGLLHDNVTHFI
jgi:hypothetical protein